MKIIMRISKIFLIANFCFAQNIANYDWMQEGLSFYRGDFLGNSIIKVDSKNNLINAGSYSAFTDYMFIQKYLGSTGELIWKLQEKQGKILDMIIDGEDNIYITGYYFNVFDLKASDTLFIKKIKEKNDAPEVEWEYRLVIGDDSSNINKRKFKITRDDSSIFVAGIKLNRKPLADIVTIKLDSSGVELWKKYFSKDNCDVSPADMLLDSESNIWIYGNSIKEDSSSLQLIKYNTDGKLLWYSTISDHDIQQISASDLEIRGGFAWVSANSLSSILLFKIDSLGNIVNKIKNETTGLNLGLSIDELGNVYQINNDKIFKYNFEGDFLSFVELPSLTNVKYSNYAIDVEKNIYIVGQRKHFYTAMLNTNMQFEFAFETNWIDQPNLSREYSTPYNLAVSSFNEVYITGNLTTYDSLNFNSSNSQVTIKYSQLPTEANDFQNNPEEFLLFQNYPNPFNPSTKIRYNIPMGVNKNYESIKVVLKVYDVLGKEVKTLVNKVAPSGNYEVEFNGSDFPSGVYFYRLQFNDFVSTKKMLLIK